MYESLIDLEHGVPQTLFVPLAYTLASEEAERIGVDHVVRMSSSEVGDKSIRKIVVIVRNISIIHNIKFYAHNSYSVSENLTAQYRAIKMLHSRVQLVLAYIQDVTTGRLEQNHEIMREAYALMSRLPVILGSNFGEEYFTVNMIFLVRSYDQKLI